MIGFNLTSAYTTLASIGLVRSKRQFSRDYLGRHWTYLRDFETRDRHGVRIPAMTVALLRTRLTAVARLIPSGLSIDIDQVVKEIDQSTRVADLLGYARNCR